MIKKIKLIFIFALLLVISLLTIKKIQTTDYVNKNNKLIKQSILLSIDEYKNNGLTGLKVLSTDCFQNLNESSTITNLIQCLAIDMTGESIDNYMSKKVGFPKDDYFHEISINMRLSNAKNILKLSDNLDTNKLRSTIYPFIEKELYK